MLIVVSLALSVMGFSALALAMDRHRGSLARGTWKPHRTTLRALGLVMLAGSLGSTIAAQGPAVGFILWIGLLSPAALAVAAVLAARSRH